MNISDALNSFGDIAKGIGQDILNNISPGTIYNTGAHKFPSNLSAKYYMDMKFYKYSRATLNEIGNAQEMGMVRLPIPANLVDGQAVNYGEEDLGTALGGGANAFMGGDASGTTLGRAGQALGAGAVGGVAGALRQFGGAAGLVGAAFGITANPFLTVLFKNPNYREYNFAWRLTPRNPAESATLQAIYASVKYHQVPAKSTGYGGAVLTYPSLVKCSIRAGQESLFPFKYGVIKNATFNFAPDGAPSFFKNGNPTSVDFSVSIQEVEYFLKHDQQRMFSRT